MEYINQGFLNGCKAEYEAGNQWALMQAIRVCASDDVPMPNWVATAYVKCFEACRIGEAKSWDDVFGKPHPKGSNLSAILKRHKNQWPLVNRIRELKAADPTLALDEGLFEKVGKEFGLGKTLASEYYYDAKQTAEKYGLW